MICPRCDEHHDHTILNAHNGKKGWCTPCYSDFLSGYIGVVRGTCENILAVLGFGNGKALKHLTDAADFEEVTANIIKDNMEYRL